jgi:cysteine desulfuration protein SufE
MNRVAGSSSVSGSSGLETMMSYFEAMQEAFLSIPRGIPTIELLVDFAKKLPALPLEYQVNAYRVPGCISNVYVRGSVDDQGKLHYLGGSDSKVIGGYVAMLVKAFDGLTPREMVERTRDPLLAFLEKTQLRANLISSRANAFGNIYLLMVAQAAAYLDDHKHS